MLGAKETSLTNYLLIVKKEEVDSGLSPGELIRSETQTASYRIWTRVADSIFWDDNHYTKHTSEIF